MRVVILAGGFGTRISEESHLRPKPMIEIGEMPILWHIMKHYSRYGFNDFLICCGYKGYVIKEYFANYFLYNSDITFDFSNNNKMVIHNNVVEPWKVTLVDTGLGTLTAGRIRRIRRYIPDGEPFMLTYGDGLSDVDLGELVEFHKSHGKTATVTAIRPMGKFGAMVVDKSDVVKVFQEKPPGDGSWINGGFFVLEYNVFDYIPENDEADRIAFEKEPLRKLVRDGNMVAFRHNGFWQPMDTKRDKDYLEGLWRESKAPWKVW